MDESNEQEQDEPLTPYEQNDGPIKISLNFGNDLPEQNDSVKGMQEPVVQIVAPEEPAKILSQNLISSVKQIPK